MTPSPRMRVLKSPSGVRRQVRAWRAAGERTAFVPTMGYFHEGHLSLMRRARRLADHVVVSIFVNPAQFGPREDFAAYPRDTARDLGLARTEGVDFCFVPDPDKVFRPQHRTEIHVGGLESRLEGVSRPTHFAGVALVVLKLLHMVEPDVLVLGQKDAQQAVVLETLLADLDLPVKVVRGSTLREPDGLAMSSRNIRLDAGEREAATVLSRALFRARDEALGGERSGARILQLILREMGREPRARLDYAAVVDARTLDDLEHLRGRVLIPLAAQVGKTRLIDNVEFSMPEERT